MADPVDPMIAIQEMLKNLTRDMASMKEEMTHLKVQSTDKAPNSREPIPQSPRVASPNSNRPTVSPFEINLEDGQYAEEHCVPIVSKEKEMYDKLEKEMYGKFRKLAQDVENMKFQGPKKFDISEFMIPPEAILPPKFKTPDYDKYDGTGCPRGHVGWFIRLSQQHGLNPEQMAQLFPVSLVGIAKQWFLRLKPEEVRTMEAIANKLVEQFSMEDGIEVTKRDLKQLKQGPQETFTSFIRRWKRKLAQLSQALSEADQIKLVVKSLSPEYFHFMAPQHYISFDHLIKTGTQTEDALVKGLRSKTLSDITEGKRPMVEPKEVHNVNSVRTPVKTVLEVEETAEKKTRKFTPLPCSLSYILKRLIKDNKIELPEQRVLPNPLPKNWRKDLFCAYHRGSGHTTDKCYTLKHKVQDMIDGDKLAIEEPFDAHDVPPLASINVISTEGAILDPASLIHPISETQLVPSSTRSAEESVEKTTLVRMENWMVKLFGQMAMLTEEVREMKIQMQHLSIKCDSTPKQLVDMGTMTEEASVQSLILDRYVDLHNGKKPYIAPKEVRSVRPSRQPLKQAFIAPREVKNVGPSRQPLKKPVVEEEKMGQKREREFTQMPCSLIVIMKKWVSEGCLRLPDIKPVPVPFPNNWRMDQYCEYHRGPGHLTENCLALKHAIQSRIEKDSSALAEIYAFVNQALERTIQPRKDPVTYVTPEPENKLKGKEKMSEFEYLENVQAEKVMSSASFQRQFGPSQQDFRGPPFPRFLNQG
ncbi:uncharacterized protein LOC143852213 [Tasmannia lanceolata]|uniref:uncharacterized protein LOC143852213 n=1 Tax=Tasmannia lanceolata TaxID=3420 RepID=UPI00406302F2